MSRENRGTRTEEHSTAQAVAGSKYPALSDSKTTEVAPSRAEVEHFAGYLLENDLRLGWTFAKGKEAGNPRVDPGLPTELGALAGYIAGKLRTRNPILQSAANGLFVVDGDTPELRDAARRIGGATLEILSGSGGTNLVYRAPDGVELAGLWTKQGTGAVEAKSDGYLVAPLALHPNGKRYRWTPNPIATLSRAQYDALCALGSSGQSESSTELRERATGSLEPLARHEADYAEACRCWRDYPDTDEGFARVLDLVAAFSATHAKGARTKSELRKDVRRARDFLRGKGNIGADIAPSSNGSSSLWTFEDLSEPGEPTLPPDVGIEGVPLFYCGQRNALSGESSGGKTWTMLRTTVDELRRGFGVVWLDLDSMGRERIRDRLVALGATPAELKRFHYSRPRVPANDATLAEIVARVQDGARLVVLDTMNPALGLHGKDPNATTDVEAFLSFLVDPVADAGGAPVTVDHVTKSSEGRGRYAYGSERKQSGADVHLSLVNLEPFGRGETGASRIVVAKDRDGWLGPQDSTVGIFELASVGSILTARVVPEVAESDELILSKRAERVSDFLEREGRSSGNTITKGVSGRALDTRSALRALVRAEHVAETKGARGARMFELVERYVLTENGPLDFVPTSSGRESE